MFSRVCLLEWRCLSAEAVPSLGDINRDPRLEGSTIPHEAFKAQWMQHAAGKR